MVRWLRWHCPPDTGFEIRALAVWGRARYLSVTEAPHNTNFHTWMGKKQFCFFQTAETGNRTPDSGVKGSGANHYPGAPALQQEKNTGFVWRVTIIALALIQRDTNVHQMQEKVVDWFTCWLITLKYVFKWQITVWHALLHVTCILVISRILVQGENT